MRLWRHIGRQRWAKVTIGITAAEYLRFVGTTTRFTLEPADIYERGEADMPIILAFWHGQHLLAPVARKIEHRVNMLVSRHRDGEINAIAARTARRRHHPRLGQSRRRFRAQSRRRRVPSHARLARRGQFDRAVGRRAESGARRRPRHHQARAGLRPPDLSERHRHQPPLVLDNWDRTTINLPFGRGAGVAAEPMQRCRATPTTPRLKRRARLLEERLNAATQRAYEIVDQPRGGD